jgi:hypothetical protein
MWCIICHNNVVGLEMLALCTKLQKGFIVYHKSNGITTMKKHVKLEHETLFKKFHKKPFNLIATNSLSREPTKK